MAVVRFIATRALVSGVNLNDVVTLNLTLAADGGLNYRREASVTVRRMISGKTEHTYYTTDEFWDANTVPLRGTDSEKTLMFLASCESGETFLWSPYQLASDESLTFVDAKLVTAPRVQNRAGHVDADGNGKDDFFSYSFTIHKAV